MELVVLGVTNDRIPVRRDESWTWTQITRERALRNERCSISDGCKACRVASSVARQRRCADALKTVTCRLRIRRRQEHAWIVAADGVLPGLTVVKSTDPTR